MGTSIGGSRRSGQKVLGCRHVVVVLPGPVMSLVQRAKPAENANAGSEENGAKAITLGQWRTLVVGVLFSFFSSSSPATRLRERTLVGRERRDCFAVYIPCLQSYLHSPQLKTREGGFQLGRVKVALQAGYSLQHSSSNLSFRYT